MSFNSFLLIEYGLSRIQYGFLEDPTPLGSFLWEVRSGGCFLCFLGN